MIDEKLLRQQIEARNKANKAMLVVNPNLDSELDWVLKVFDEAATPSDDALLKGDEKK